MLAASSWYLKTEGASIVVSATTARAIHATLQLGALGSLITGLIAIYRATVMPTPQPALTSMHAWVGTAAVSFYLLNFLLAVVREIVKLCGNSATGTSSRFLALTVHAHRFLGLLALLSTSSAIVTGVMDFNGSSCDYAVTQPDINPAQHYGLIPSGCRISNGNHTEIFNIFLRFNIT